MPLGVMPLGVEARAVRFDELGVEFQEVLVLRARLPEVLRARRLEVFRMTVFRMVIHGKSVGEG
jgi:hypothetical protein